MAAPLCLFLHPGSAKVSIYFPVKAGDNLDMNITEECMKITSFGGQAKSLALRAIEMARLGDFAGADRTMAEAGDYLKKSHEAHTELLCSEADEDAVAKIEVTFFMVHAADHLSSADTVFLLAEEFILLYNNKKGGKKDA